jgi:apolipoprotein N-acyltransferase
MAGTGEKRKAIPKAGGGGALVHWAVAIPLAIASGCLVFLSFPTFDLFPLQWIALAPLLIAVRGRGPAAAAWLGFLAGWATNIGGFHWMSDLLREFGHMSHWPSLGVMALMAAYQGLTVAIATWLSARVSTRTPLPWALVFPVLFTAVEYAVPFIFPWYFANGQQRFYAATQVVELTGVAGLTFLLVLVNCAVAEVAIARIAGRPFPWAAVSIAGVLLIADIAYGVVRIGEVDRQVADARKLKVGMVEADVGIWEKEAKNPDGTPLDAPAQIRMLFRNLLRHQYLTADLLKREPGLDLVLWPESSYVPLQDVYARRTGFLAIAATAGGRVAFLGDAGEVAAPAGGDEGMRTTGIRGVAAAHEAFVLAVGPRGAAFRFDGQGWAREPTGSDRDLLAVAVSTDGGEAMAVGSQGTAVVRRGGEWKPVETHTNADLRSVAWTPDRGFVAVGDGGVMLAFRDGSHAIPSGTTADLLAASWSAESGLVAVGAGGTALRLRHSGAVTALETGTQATLRSVAAGAPTRVLAEGSRLFECGADACASGPQAGHGATVVASDGGTAVWVGDSRGHVDRVAPGGGKARPAGVAKLEGAISAIAYVPMREGYPLPHDVTWIQPARTPLPAAGIDDLDRAVDADAHTSGRDRNAAIRGFSAPLLFGAITYSDATDRAGEREYYNTALLAAPDGKVLGRYDKNYLLLFGEYLPFARWFPFLKKWLPEAGDFVPGESVEVFDLGGVRLGVMVCYEDIIPSFTRRLAGKDPNVLVNVTNDAWFGKTAEPYLHMQLATFRAIENRLFLLRSTNTGVSVVVDPVGRVVQETSLDGMETILADVAVMSGDTIYRRFGDVFAWACCGLALIFVAISWRRKA